ncbi:MULTISPECIES: DUF4405 domain-containing protein [Rhizobium]|uniref:DUF4405 domain-containing protein n=1 Tax=Rhizobium tropici TaxID=398 RepID=A0A6P1C3S5_RHITR|nr:MULTISPECIES: DUF4405 domain-containing protein [Rhizobium]AGB73128.1 hypothetical protein RTCIAT899_PA00130 [Rhizobium tropici CIAT 899]MBB4243632.1 hypothetical protein [Rhizobium tropici]MBB5595919.1 hypothetical protein [Rhizobium tropici]MBB6493912.1 hypothetical protein [Rhizobium tropici]NEV11347.1 DUF4405 domain-containing protein [Rhizobium tropici]
MKPLFLFRSILDILAIGLLLAAFAYDWFGNRVHEIIGTLMFGLLISHNVFNRRWYGMVAKGWREPRAVFSKTITLCLMVMMVGLFVTSVIISQAVFDFLSLRSSSTTRQVHALIAYLVLLMAALHVGLQWSMIMRVIGQVLRVKVETRIKTVALRGLAFLIAIYGVHSLFVIDIGPKLRMETTFNFWDFEAAAAEFILRHAAIIALCAMIAHYSLKLLSLHKRDRRSPATTK